MLKLATEYDTALDFLSQINPVFEDGRPNNGAIIVDVLAAAGQSKLMESWLREYTGDPGSMPPAKHPITRDNWQTALGHHDRIGDWAHFFQRELEHVGWNRILRDWLPRLLPGMSGAAGHAIVRAASVVRNLIVEETDARVRELGIALGFWASSFRKLPGILGSRASGTFTPLEALSHIKWQHKEQLPDFPSIDESLRGLERYSPFAGVLNLIKIPATPLDVISSITTAMSKVFIANSPDHRKVVPFALAVILPSALRSFTLLLEPSQTIAMLRYGWQFAGAMYAIYGRVNPVDECPEVKKGAEEIINDAVASRSEYALIFTDSCLGEYNIQPDPIYLAAASNAIARLSEPADHGEVG